MESLFDLFPTERLKVVRYAVMHILSCKYAAALSIMQQRLDASTLPPYLYPLELYLRALVGPEWLDFR